MSLNFLVSRVKFQSELFSSLLKQKNEIENQIKVYFDAFQRQVDGLEANATTSLTIWRLWVQIPLLSVGNRDTYWPELNACQIQCLKDNGSGKDVRKVTPENRGLRFEPSL